MQKSPTTRRSYRAASLPLYVFIIARQARLLAEQTRLSLFVIYFRRTKKYQTENAAGFNRFHTLAVYPKRSTGSTGSTGSTSSTGSTGSTGSKGSTGSTSRLGVYLTLLYTIFVEFGEGEMLEPGIGEKVVGRKANKIESGKFLSPNPCRLVGRDVTSTAPSPDSACRDFLAFGPTTDWPRRNRCNIRRKRSVGRPGRLDRTTICI